MEVMDWLTSNVANHFWVPPAPGKDLEYVTRPESVLVDILCHQLCWRGIEVDGRPWHNAGHLLRGTAAQPDPFFRRQLMGNVVEDNLTEISNVLGSDLQLKLQKRQNPESQAEIISV